MKQIKLLLLAWLLLLLPATSYAQTNELDTILSNIEETEFLEVDDAFKLSADVIGDEIAIRWEVAPGYYLYNHQLDFVVHGADISQTFIYY